MIRGREWCTLTPMVHVVLSKVVYDSPAEGICHALTVAELPGPALLGRVQYGLSVKPYDVDRGQIDVPTSTQRLHSLTMQIGHFPFYAGHIDAVRRKKQERAAQIGRVMRAQLTANSQMSLPIRFKKCCVDTVHRRAAHQSDCPESTRCDHLICSLSPLSGVVPLAIGIATIKHAHLDGKVGVVNSTLASSAYRKSRAAA